LWKDVSIKETKVTEAHFDHYQFDGRRARPVSALTGISFEDYVAMSTRQHKPSNERRLPTPIWATNDELLRNLLVVFMEERCGIKNPQGTLLERLKVAQQAVINQHSRMRETLHRLCIEYVQLKQRGVLKTEKEVDAEITKRYGQPPLPFGVEYNKKLVESDRLRELEVEIEGLDTYLRYTRTGGADVLAAIVYLYYRAGLDSVGVAIELGLKPPHVRQLLWRLWQTWNMKFSSQQQTETAGIGPLFDGIDKY
jgi:hypothetical protein